MKTGNPGSRRTPAIRSFATLATLLAAGVCGSAQFALENPQPNGYESGVGIVSGWHCTATEITLRFDCAADHAVCRDTFTAGSGTYRGDTAGVCGDTDNGFAFLVNFNNMGTGQKTVHAFADGVEFAAANFIVNHLGNRFISGLSAWTEVTLPALGKGARLTWQQSKQSFVITEIETLDFTLDQLLALAAGTWSGSWESPVGTGQLTMSLGVTGSGNNRMLIPTAVTLTGTGCAQGFTGATPISSIDFPMSAVSFSDGALVEIEFMASESLSMLSGAFSFDAGPCMDREGAFILYRQ